MSIVLRGVTLVDGTGSAPVPDAVVEVAGERIVTVGGPAPTGGHHIDLTGLTLTPGLIDAHTHLGLVDVAGLDRTAASVLAAKIFEVCSLALDAGFTTVRDAGGVDGGLAQAVAMGLVRGPRILPSGPVLCQSGGHGDLRPPFLDHHHGGVPGLVTLSRVCDGPDEVRRAAREALRRGATQVKVCVSGGVVSLSDDLEDTQFAVDELVAAVEEAGARRTYVMAHAHNTAGIRNGLKAGVRSFEHATFLDPSTAAEIASAGAYVVPTLAVVHLLASEWEQWGLPPEAAERVAGIEEAMTLAVKVAADAGVRMGSGSDLLGPRQDRRGLELVLRSRIQGPTDALVSATSVNAELLRLDDEIGTVTQGKRADLVAWEGNPLSDPDIFDDPPKAVLVMQGGRVVKDPRGLTQL